jgi:isocitrate dehydrogenase
MYWAQELAAQKDDPALAKHFATLAETLVANEKKIVDELRHVQGKPADIGGYKADVEKVKVVMCPSPTFNAALAAAS